MTSLYFFVKIQYKQRKLYCGVINEDVLLNVELFHAWTWALAFPIAQFSFFSIFRGSLVTQNVYRKRENLTKNAEISKKFGPFPNFLQC